MRQGSLRIRLFTAAALLISVSLLLAGSTFYFLFERYIERLTAVELNNHFVQLVGRIANEPDGKVAISRTLSDPRFQKPYGGLYWQVDVVGQPSLRSRSLWDDQLSIAAISTNDTHGVRVLPGPHGKSLLVMERVISIEKPDGTDRQLLVAVAVDRDQIASATTSFSWDLAMGLGALYIALLAGSLMQIGIGLKPLEMLRSSIEGIRKGSAKKIDSSFPDEVRPLVEEVNGLLAAREEQLVRARQRASNLAHGLKTPLTVMTAVADSVAEAGLNSEAEDILRGARQMHDLVERELARARMASGHAPALVLLKPVVDRIIKSFVRSNQEQALQWDVNVPEEAQVAIESGDLMELLGNLVENGRKWAKARVRIGYENDTLTIEDDGPGVPQEKIATIQSRGVKLDEAKPGSGLGLAIVRDLAELYGLTLKFDRSKLGGLMVSLQANSR